MIVKSEILDDTAGTRLVGGLMGDTGCALINDPGTYAAVLSGRIRPASMDDAAFDKATPPNKNDQEINADTTFYVRNADGVHGERPLF